MSKLQAEILRLSKNNDIEEIEKILEKELDKYQNNIDLLLKLSVLELAIPLVDFPRSIFYLNKIIAFNKNHPLANLLLAYVYEHHMAGISESLKDKLVSISSESAEINSMLRYAASWFFRLKEDFKGEEKMLRESLVQSDKHVWNHIRLAELYFSQGQSVEARDLVKKALKNVQKVYSDDLDDDDLTDFNEFLSEHIKGVFLSDLNFNRIERMLQH